MISVIIPVYNGQNYVYNILDALLKQTYEDIEIIIVDDGSTDETASVISAYSTKDNRVKYVYQHNAGPGTARNTGISKAQGQYITFVDADDLLPENYIKVLTDAVQNRDMAICSLNITDNAKKNIQIAASDGIYHRDAFVSATMKGEISPLVAISGPVNRIWRRDIIKNNNLFFDVSYRYGEDTLFNLIALQHCSKIAVTDKTTYIAQERPDSLSRTFSHNRFDAYGDINSALYRLLPTDYQEIKINTAQYFTDNFLARAREILALTSGKNEKIALLKALASSGIVTGREIVLARGKNFAWKWLAKAVDWNNGQLILRWFIMSPKMKL